MQEIILNSEHVLDYVEGNIEECLGDKAVVEDDKFHHNTKYKDAISVIENGILSPSELNKMGVEGFDDEVIKTMDDLDSHANGSESISLAVVGLDDLNPDEFEYDPFSEKQVDILITSDIVARRVTTNYGNEFLSDKSIDVDKFRAIDTRLLSFVQTIREKTGEEAFDSSVRELLDSYNKLRDMAHLIKKIQLDVPLREMSGNDGLEIDVDKISNMPKVKIKS